MILEIEQVTGNVVGPTIHYRPQSLSTSPIRSSSRGLKLIAWASSSTCSILRKPGALAPQPCSHRCACLLHTPRLRSSRETRGFSSKPGFWVSIRRYSVLVTDAVSSSDNGPHTRHPIPSSVSQRLQARATHPRGDNPRRTGSIPGPFTPGTLAPMDEGLLCLFVCHPPEFTPQRAQQGASAPVGCQSRVLGEGTLAPSQRTVATGQQQFCQQLVVVGVLLANLFHCAVERATRHKVSWEGPHSAS